MAVLTSNKARMIESPYDADFVSKIRIAEKSKKYAVEIDKMW